MTKIFSISENDWAGSGYFLSEAINSHTEYRSRSMRAKQSHLEFPYDMLDLTERQLNELWSWADVIHIHDAPGFETEELPHKPTIITYHSARFRNAADTYIQYAREMRYIATVATPDLTRFGLPLLPDCRPDLSDQVTDKHDTFTVCHAPTKREVKGTGRVIKACKRLNVNLELIENEPWEKCIERKARCHLLVDQFELGFGCNAIEAWSMGMPVISDAEPQAEQAILHCFGKLPYAKPEPSLADAIARIRDDVGWRWGWKTIGNDHYKKWHSPKVAAKISIGFYRQAVERHLILKSTEKLSRNMNLPPGELILMRYLGGNIGEQQWFPSDGTKVRYTFDAKIPIRYVHEKDVPWFVRLKGRNDKPLFEVVK